MSVRVYTNLTIEQFDALEAISKRDDRSISWLVARAIDEYIGDVSPCDLKPKDATKKVFTRTTAEAAARVKTAADKHQCEEWRLTNSAVANIIA